MKKIEIPKFDIQMSYHEAILINSLIDRANPKKAHGKCPVCERKVTSDFDFCPSCGQNIIVAQEDPDLIPLNSPEF